MTREEAISTVKSNWPDSRYTMLREALETLIPELTESEDERIRKGLIKMISNIDGGHPFENYGIIKKEALAYLEKQKELFKSGRGLYYYDGEKTTYCGHPATEENPYDFAMSQQEKQKEQKPWKVGANAYFTPEQKPAEWGEEDEKHINSIFNDFKQNVIPDEEDQEWLKNRFKSLRPQPKQEWSEEDKKTLNAIISVLKEIKSQPLKRLEDWDGYIRFLESLRPQWKPSEEQMDALLNAEGILRTTYYPENAKFLAEIYEQLEKL